MMRSTSPRRPGSISPEGIWHLALATFVLAATTGLLLRPVVDRRPATRIVVVPTPLRAVVAALPLLVVLALAGSATLVAATAASAQEQPDGAELFRNNCATCHGSAGEGQGTAPPLAGNDRAADAAHVEEILRNGLTGPIEVDGRTYDDEMPSFSWLSDDELGALAAFVTGLQDGAAESPPPEQPAEPVVGDAARGEAFFTGRADLMAGGPSCAACHSAGRFRGLRGTTLGPDLTTAAERFGGEAGLAQALANPPSPVMQPLFANAALTDQERADLAAFLTGVGQQPAPAARADVLTLGGAGGLVALLALMAVLWRGRHRHFLTRRSAR